MADNGDRKPLIENVTREALVRASIPDDATPAAADPKRAPVGHAERILSFKDRNNLFGACRAFCAREGHQGFKDQTKLDRLNKIILFEETLEYFAMLDDSLEDEIRAWQRSKKHYKLWKNYKAGLIKAEDFRRELPGANPDEEPPKPSLLEPQTKPEEARGKERSFYLPSKLDSWAQDAIRAMDWSPFAAQWTVELCEKFGIKDEEMGG